MQTVLVVQSALPGAVYLNGRLAGETDPDRPLTLPVAPFGPLLIELHPFAPGYIPLTLRIPFSKGTPLLPDPDPRLCAAVWPGGVTELELRPEPLPSGNAPKPVARIGDILISFSEGMPATVLCETVNGAFRHPLPDDALPPAAAPLPAGILLTGRFKERPEEQYALVLSPDGSSVLFADAGRNISLQDDGSALHILRSCGDSVGHAALETWKLSPAGAGLTASEPMWLNGAPHRPETPEATVVAAVEAAQLGFMNEAAAYFSPVFPCMQTLARAAEYDGCVPLRYPAPGGEPAVGLMKFRSNMLHIVPARYSASPGGPHSGWLITRLEISDSE